MGIPILLLAGMLAFEDPPKDVIDFFRSAAAALGEAHQDGNARAFLNYFDKNMPGYAEFSDRIEAMAGEGDVFTTIEFVNVEGTGQKLSMDLDWSLQLEGERPKRAVINCTIEKSGKKWKVTSIAPIDFFKRN